MSRADTLKKIADHHYALAEFFLELAGESATAPVSAARPAAADSLPAVPASLPPSFDELPPEEWDVGSIAKVLPQTDVLGECPDHQRPWTIKEGGISKTGKPYKAFWKCNGKTPDGEFCNKKPDPAWVKTHDAEKALAAA